MIGKAREAMATQQLHQVLNAVWAVVADANRYFAGEAPWALAKTDPQRQGTILYVTAEVLRQVAILALPFMPASAAKLLDLVAVPEQGARLFRSSAARIALPPGPNLPAPAAIFPRYVESEGQAGAIKRTNAMLIDSHCHLDFPDFAAELDAVVVPRPRRRHRAHGHDLARGSAATARCWRSPSAFPTCSARSAPTRITPTRNST